MRYKDKLRRARIYADKIKKKQEIYNVKHQYDSKKKVEFSKIILIIIFINCVVIEIYSMWVMYALADLSALPALIGAIIGECGSACCYFIKSMVQNRIGGITYEAMQHTFLSENDLTSEELEDAVG